MIEEIQRRRWDFWETIQTCQQSMLTLIQQNAPLTACDFHPSTLFKINGRGIFIWKDVSNSVGPRLTQGGKKLWKNGSVNTLQKLVVVESLSHVWLWVSTNCSTLSFTVLHHLLELVQTHVHWVSDAIQPSHPLSPPCLLTLNLFHYRGLFKWVGALDEVDQVLEFQFQH